MNRTVHTTILLLLVLTSCLTAQSVTDSPDSLTISALQSENKPLDIRAALYPFPFRPTDSIASVIRRIVRPICVIDRLSETDAIERALWWVHSLWKHDPVHSIAEQCASPEIIQRARRGERFSCVEYAKVLSDVLVSFGYAARMVGLSRRNISNPSTGARHVAVEVWSCQHDKWMFVDPQFGLYPTAHDTVLSALELQRAIASSSTALRFTVVDSIAAHSQTLVDSVGAQYTQFIVRHTAFTDIPILNDKNVGMAMLVPQDRNEPLLFQGTPLSRIQYTKDPAMLYASLGTLHMDLDYDYSANKAKALLQKPGYRIVCTSSYPWIRHFEFKVDKGDWQTMSTNTVYWQLHHGTNEFRTRALCSSGCYSKESFLKVYYGQRAEARRIRQHSRETGDLPVPGP